MMLHMARRRALWACLGLALALAACDDSPAARESARLEKAQEYAVAGDLAAAIIELKNALTDNPDNANARAMLGELYFRSGDPASAIKELERARALGQSSDELRLLLARAHLQTGEYQAVLDDVPADQLLTTDVGAGLLAARGEALFALGKFEEAKTTLEAVVAGRPMAAAYAGLARLSLFRGDADAAGKYLDAGLEKFAADAQLRQLKGDQQMQAHEFEAARNTFDALSKGDPGNVIAGIGLARAELALGRTEPARVVIDDLLEKNPDNLGVVLLRGVAALQARDFVAAQQDANAVRAADEANPTALYVAGASSYALEQYEQALRALTRYVSVAPNDLAGRKLLAATQVRMGDPDSAQKTLGANADPNDPQYLALMSSASALSGDIGAGVKFLEQAVLQSPEDARLRTQLGILRIASGDPALGQADLEHALDIDPGLANDPRFNRAEIALIQSYLTERRLDEALVAIAKWQEKFPDEALGFVLAGAAYGAMGDDVKAREAFTKAIELRPEATDAASNLAVIELRQGNAEAAELVLQQALSHAPGDLRVLLMLAQLSERAGERNKTRNWLEKAVVAHPDSSQARLALARLYFELRQPDRTLEMIAPVVREAPDYLPALEVKARAELETGRIEDAIKTYESIVTKAPNAAQSQYELSQAYFATGDLDSARTAAEAALAADSNHSAARLHLARVLIRQRDVPGAERIVAELASAFPNAADVKEVQGDLALLQGDAQHAVAFYRDARNMADNARLAAAEARALAAAGDDEAAASTLEQWIDGNPRDTAARFELNRYYQAAGRAADAEANLRAVIEYDPNSWVARTALARLLDQRGELVAARTEAERAHELAPTSPIVMDTLGVILLEQGEAERAIALIRRASEAAPTNPDIRFHLAQAYALGDRREEARHILAKLLEEHPDFSEREQAASLLAELGG